MSCFFSIIIPVYNTEQYLPRALDSILNQTFDNKKIEVIVINDGSPKAGECRSIVKEYSKKLSIKFIDNEKNQGLYIARKLGIENVDDEGRYLLHLDSDDYLSKNACKVLYEDIQKNGDADYIEFDYYELTKNVKKKAPAIKDTYTRNILGVLSFEQSHTIWNKCYKISFVKNIYVELPNFYSYYYEDYYQIGILEYYITKRRKLNKHLYVYVKENGITNIQKYSKEKLKKIFTSTCNIEKYLCDFYKNKNCETYIPVIMKNSQYFFCDPCFNHSEMNDFFDTYIEIFGIERFKTFAIIYYDNLNRTISAYEKKVKLLLPIKILIKPFRSLYRFCKKCNKKEV